jgi:hypothetical protein
MDIPALDSRIESVTVYASGAAVTRVAELAPAGGAWPAQVRLVNLPLALEDGSVKVRVEGAGDAVPAAVGVRVALEVPDVAKPEPADAEALREARREVLLLRARLGDCTRLAERLSQLAMPDRPEGKEGEPPPPSPHAARLGLLEFQQERLAALGEEKRDLEVRRRGAEERLADLLDRKRRAGTAREAREHELRKTAVVSLRVPVGGGAVPARLVLEYHVPGARWAPSYVLRFEKDWSRVGLALRAMVAQRTGEDWRGVRLTLSTADRQAWTELPEMTSIRIGRWQPPPRSGWRPPPVGAEDLYDDFDRADIPERPEPAMPEEEPEPAPEAEAATERRPKGDVGAAAGATPRQAPRPSARPPMAKKAMAPPPPPPAPPAAAAPMPCSAPAPMRAAKLERARAASVRDEEMVAAEECAASFDAFGADDRSAGAPPQEPEPAGGPGEWLEYGRLRMPGPAESGRGRLARAEAASLYLELLAQIQVKVRFDVVSVVESARDAAEDLGDLPPAHDYPGSVGGFDYAYPAEPAAEIPSDGQFHAIPLLSREGPAGLYYVTVPREAPDVFRFTELVNPLDAPLLAGPADVYAGGDFLMTVPVRLTAPRGRLTLGLGVEEALKVARNTTFAEEASGLLGGTLNLRHEIRIELRNLLKAPAQVEVRERIPVTAEGEKDVKVAVTAVAPPWEPYEPEGEGLKGGHRWLVPVKAGETAALKAAYTVTLPGKMEIVGGNRRER